MTDEHEFIEPGERVLEAIALRDGADQRVADGIVAADEFEEVAEGEYANRRQVEARRDIDTASHDLWMDVAEQAAGVGRVYMYDPPHGGNGFKVTDKRAPRV